ncbi:hypothetical protein NDU88_000861 [Pleurodeles waltl]|uniref:Uncharacterized protein n=1 Tax=Pleurodeles waltl TaxID=8319 RepID=A0AAV7UR53_PLEWA|nr:hypothetical protein NDU88_000861 [Pleurodeles waltl]
MSASHVAHERSKKLPEPPVMFRGRREQAPPPIPIRRRPRRPRGGGHASQPVHGPGGGTTKSPRPQLHRRSAPGQQWKKLSSGRGGRGSSPKRCRAQRRACCPPAKGSPRRCTPTSPSGLRDGAPGLATRQDGGRSSRGSVVVQEPPFLAAQTPP